MHDLKKGKRKRKERERDVLMTIIDKLYDPPPVDISESMAQITVIID